MSQAGLPAAHRAGCSSLAVRARVGTARALCYWKLGSPRCARWVPGAGAASSAGAALATWNCFLAHRLPSPLPLRKAIVLEAERTWDSLPAHLGLARANPPGEGGAGAQGTATPFFHFLRPNALGSSGKLTFSSTQLCSRTESLFSHHLSTPTQPLPASCQRLLFLCLQPPNLPHLRIEFKVLLWLVSPACSSTLVCVLGKLIHTPGPLHQLFPPPGMLFFHKSVSLPPSLPSGLFQNVTLTKRTSLHPAI